MYYLYMIKDVNNRLYVGITNNVDRRLATHNRKAGALFTSSSKFHLVFEEKYETLAQARKREVQIKKWRREKKEMLTLRYVNGLSTRMK